MRLWETPVPIPNTTVKTQAADGTALETVWESRWPPDQKENNRRKSAEYKYRHWKVSPVGNRVEPEKIDKSDANPYQPGSAVHKLVLPVI